MDGKDDNFWKMRLGIFEDKHHETLKGETFRVFAFLGAVANQQRNPKCIAEVGVRQASRFLGISKTTVRKALGQLMVGGYIKETAKGFHIAKLIVRGSAPGDTVSMGQNLDLGQKVDRVGQDLVQGGSGSDPPTGVNPSSDADLQDRRCVDGKDRGDTPLSPPPPPPVLVLKQEKNKSASTKKKRSKKKPHPTVGKLEWDPVKLEFRKGRKEIREALNERYLKSHGDDWITTVYRGMREKLIWQPEMIQGKESQWMFVLNWYQRAAQDKSDKEARWNK